METGDRSSGPERSRRILSPLLAGTLLLSAGPSTGAISPPPLTAAPLPFVSMPGSETAYEARLSNIDIRSDRQGIHFRIPGHDGTLNLRLDGVDLPAPVPEQPRRTRVTRLVGTDRSAWRHATLPFGRLRYPGVYPGIDLVLYERNGRLEYDFIVAPGADPERIRLAVDGGTAQLAPGGRLRFGRPGRWFSQSPPVSYQIDADGRRQAVDSRYVVDARGRIGFRVAAYDPGRTLVIDPVLVYGSYLGGQGPDRIHAIAVDAAGNTIVVGETAAGGFSAQSSRRCTSNTTALCPSGTTASSDAFVAKIDPQGRLVFTTYLGGSRNDAGLGVAIDANGGILVTGTTNSSDFPTAGPSPGELNRATAACATVADPAQNAACLQDLRSGGFRDAFVARLSPDGGQLTYSRYLGGRADDVGLAITTDATGQAHVTGWTLSPDLPTVNPVQAASGGKRDVFVARFDGNGNPVYSSYLGGHGDDEPRAIAVDAAGRIYLTGFTASGNQDLARPTPRSTTPWPTTAGAYDTLCGSTGACDGSVASGGGRVVNYDAFVTRLDSGGTTIGYSTFLGGRRYDYGNAIAVTSTGDIVVGGETASADFPVTPNAYDTDCLDDGNGRCGRSADGFVVRLTPNGGGTADLVFGTYLGGSHEDLVSALALDTAERIHLTGTTLSDDFPTTSDGLMPGPPDRPDNAVLTRDRAVYAARLDQTGNRLEFSSWYGGLHEEQGTAIAVDDNGRIHVAGYTTSHDLPITTTAAQSAHGDRLDDAAVTADDGFVVRIDEQTQGDLAVDLVADAPGTIGLGQSIRYTATIRNLGTLPATGIVLEDRLPPQAVLFDPVRSDPACTPHKDATACPADRLSAEGCQPYVGLVRCRIDALAAGASRTLSIVVQPKNQGTYTHTVAVSAVQSEADTSNDTASVSVTVEHRPDPGGGSAGIGPALLALLPPLLARRRRKGTNGL